MVKKLIGAIIGTGLLLATTLPAFAADCTIGTSGPFSSNTCKIKAPKTAMYTQKNRALVIKVQSSDANTGGNLQDFNTTVSGGGITTQNATSDIDPAVANPVTGDLFVPTTDVNSSEVGVDQSVSPGGGGSINTSGPFSSNTVDVDHSKTAVVGVDNAALVVTTQNSTANSGANSMSFNTTTSGSIHTGNASSSVTSNMYVNYSSVNIAQ